MSATLLLDEVGRGALAPAVVAGAACLAAGAALAPVAGQALDWARPGRNVFFARWGFALVLLSALAAVLAGWTVDAFVPEPHGPLLARVAALAAGIAVAARGATRVHPEGWRALGLVDAGGARDVLAALVLLVASAPALLGAALVWTALLEPGARTWWAAAEAARGGDALALAVVLLLWPLVAEVFLRGFLLPLFAQNFSERGGLVLVALLGAGLTGAGAFGAQVVLGVACGTLRLRTQRVLPGVLLHALYNAAALALGPGGDPPVWTPL